MNLEERVVALSREVERLMDAQKVQNLMSRMTYLNGAGMFDEMVELFAQRTPGVTVQVGARGIFEGREGARKTLAMSGRLIEQVHAEGMQKAFPELKFPSPRAGMQENQSLGSPIIEVAEDGRTAKGLWSAPVSEARFNERVNGPDAFWMWIKFAVDFVKEDDEWRIWHYNVLPLFRTHYEKSWTQKLPPAGMARDPHAGFPTADRPPNEFYNPFGVDAVPRYVPRPPEPYRTFDETFSY